MKKENLNSEISALKEKIDFMAAEIRGYEKQVQEKIEGAEEMERRYQSVIRDRDRYKALMAGETARADQNAELIRRIRRNVTIANRVLMNAVLETN
jgi:UDP-N-acetylglucosamine enolpyruvyl transferase